MKNNFVKFIVLIAFFFLNSCNNNSQASTQLLPGLNIPPEDINKQIQLDDASELGNSHKNGGLLSLGLTNLSDKLVIFPPDFGLRIITKNGQNWIDIQNNNFSGSVSHYLPTKKSWPSGLIVDTRPYTKSLKSSFIIRVVVVGNLEIVDGEPVGAYLDVELNP